MSTSTGVPTAQLEGTYAYAIDCPTVYPNPLLVTRPTTLPSILTGSEPSTTQRGSWSTRHASLGADCVLRLSQRAGGALEATFSSLMAKPRPARDWATCGVMFAGQ